MAGREAPAPVVETIMNQIEILGGLRDRAGGYKVDASRGERVSRVSSEWFSRPPDERYLSLSACQ